MLLVTRADLWTVLQRMWARFAILAGRDGKTGDSGGMPVEDGEVA